MNVVILDTGCANLNSVKSAIARHGYEPKVSRDPDVVLLADKLFLPGVGTAQAAMDQVRERELFDLIKACTQPVLGICLGMQLLGRRSEESNGIDLLGIIDEDVPAEIGKTLLAVVIRAVGHDLRRARPVRRRKVHRCQQHRYQQNHAWYYITSREQRVESRE